MKSFLKFAISAAAVTAVTHSSIRHMEKRRKEEEEMKRAEKMRKESFARQILISFDDETKEFSGPKRYTGMHTDLETRWFSKRFDTKELFIEVDHTKKTISVTERKQFAFPQQYCEMRNKILEKDGVFYQYQQMPFWSALEHRFVWNYCEDRMFADVVFPCSQSAIVKKTVYDQDGLLKEEICKPIVKGAQSKEEFLAKQNGPVSKSLQELSLDQCLYLDTENEKTVKERKR